MEVRDRVVIVTGGGGGGMGRTISLRLARAGARIVAADIDEAAAGETVRLIQERGGQAAAVRADRSQLDRDGRGARPGGRHVPGGARRGSRPV